MTIYDKLADMTKEERIAAVGCVDMALLGIRAFEPLTVAAASCGTWACPEYLAAALGFAFDCPEPHTADKTRCERCAAAFLRMQWPNTGRRRQDGT